ncbi:MAG: trypsin-like serine protease [Planctomycetota bacterium]|nr:MAG: trypsin-like serine protease [Planctomycetota bacterium]
MQPKLGMILFAALVPALAAQQAQQPSVDAQPQPGEVVPARPGDEGAPRYHVDLPPDLANLPAAPMPVFSGVHRGPNLAVTFNPATGEETFLAVPEGPMAPYGWVTGSKVADDVNESLMRTFGGFTTITSQSFPWSAQCYMSFTQGGSGFRCSGTLIDARTMITAGHCVHEGPGGTWSGSVVVTPAYDGDANAFGSANGIHLGSWTGWTVSGSWSGDQGYVRLDRPVGALTSWLGYGYNSSNSFFDTSTFNMAGYPGFAGSSLQYAWGDFDRVYTDTMEADFSPTQPWIGGASGSGVYWINGSGNRYVYGNCSYSGPWPYTTSEYFGACRMTSSKFTYVRDTFIPGAYGSVVDYVPLDTNVGAGPVRAGALTTGLNYLVFNNSSANPASATVDMDVYLSSNDNISTADTKLSDQFFTWDFAAKSSVRVNGVNPTIPVSTTPGSYFVGVIVDEVDADDLNDDTDGWDAAPITIIEPVNSISLTGPASGLNGSTITLSYSGAPASAPFTLYRSRNLNGSTINGHPFSVGAPLASAKTGTTGAAGSGTINTKIMGTGLWYYELRVDRTVGATVYTHDSNAKRVNGL